MLSFRCEPSDSILANLPSVAVDRIASFLNADDLWNINVYFNFGNLRWKEACRLVSKVSRTIPVPTRHTHEKIVSQIKFVSQLFVNSRFHIMCRDFSANSVYFLRTLAVLLGDKLENIVISQFKSKKLILPSNPSFSDGTEVQIHMSPKVEVIDTHKWPLVLKMTSCKKLKKISSAMSYSNMLCIDGQSLLNSHLNAALAPTTNRLVLRLSDVSHTVHTKNIAPNATHVIVVGGTCVIGESPSHVKLEYVKEVRFENPEKIKVLVVQWPETQTVGITQRLTRDFSSCTKYQLLLRRSLELNRVKNVILQYTDAVRNPSVTWPSLEETILKLYITTTNDTPCPLCKAVSMDISLFYGWSKTDGYTIQIYKICYSGKCHKLVLDLKTESSQTAQDALIAALQRPTYSSISVLD